MVSQDPGHKTIQDWHFANC